jgi:hypothetical protein
VRFPCFTARFLCLIEQAGYGEADWCHSACNIDPLSRGIGVQN